MIYGWNEKMLMNIRGFSFDKIISGEKLEYAEDLLRSYFEKKDFVFKLIEPKLVNWDPDRIANLDMIILHLGICEFLYFPTIPVKVTINEYIDLAKSYSTPQSGQFVNGLLDNVRKDLEKNNQLHKTQYIKK
jgi:N utilization substance protein B